MSTMEANRQVLHGFKGSPVWGDMPALPEVASGLVLFSRIRGQQRKEPARLPRPTAYVDSLCKRE